MQFIDLQKAYRRIQPEASAAVEKVLLSGRYIGGEEVEAFAEELGRWMGVRHVIPVANGTDALQVALMAAGFRPGDEILVPSFTYVASVEAIVLLGLKPVLVDVDEDTFCTTPELLEKGLSSRTRGLIPVHLFGQACPMADVLAFARRYGLICIEDNAQSMGASYLSADSAASAGEMRDMDSSAPLREIRTGTESHLSCTSFFPTKNLACMGDGGAITTNDSALARRALQMARHGQAERYRHETIGCNSRLDALQAALLRIRLRHLDEYIARRKAVAERYCEELDGLPGVRLPLPALSTPGHSYNQYTLRVEGGAARRDALAAYLREQGVPTMIYYPLPIHRQPAYREYAPAYPLPVSERLCTEVLSLPVHPELTEEEQGFIIQTLLNWKG